MTAVLQVKDLKAYYGQTQALHGVSFELKQGGITTLLGANGAGKTTTLRAICNMVRTEGTVVYDGKPIIGGAAGAGRGPEGDTKRALVYLLFGAVGLIVRRIWRGPDAMPTESIVRRGIAHVPEGRGTFTTMTVDENLRLAAYTRSDKIEIKRDLDMVLEYFPRLRERINQQAGTLSGGEQQMLAVSRALMLRPRLMLLDEPSFGLAPLIVVDIFRILRRINSEAKCSMLLVEQNAALALELADHAYVLETGRVVMSGPSDVVKNDENVRKSYLGY